MVVAEDLREEGGRGDRRGEDPVAGRARLVGDGLRDVIRREDPAEEQLRVEDEGEDEAAELSAGGGGAKACLVDRNRRM
jgi:hypothetical protein